MIGNAASCVHARAAQTRIMHGRVEADAQRHQRAEHEVAGRRRSPGVAPSRPSASPPPGTKPVRRSDHDRRRRRAAARPCRSGSGAAASATRRRRRARRPATAAAIIEHQRRHLDLDDGDEDERLRRRWGWRGPTFSVPGMLGVVDDPPELVQRRRRRERSDPQRVEEVGDDADHQVERPRSPGGLQLRRGPAYGSLPEDERTRRRRAPAPRTRSPSRPSGRTHSKRTWPGAPGEHGTRAGAWSSRALLRRKPARDATAEIGAGGAHGLRRVLGAFDLTLLGVGAIVGRRHLLERGRDGGRRRHAPGRRARR